ncbi:MAG: protein kinase [Anaerolineae bacterium]|nr:protein kinase [Anaerolineae bacterium]
MKQSVEGEEAIKRRAALVAEDPLTETYRALDEDGHPVLMRIPRPSEDGFGADRLRHEAAVLATLRHPGLVNLVRATETPLVLMTEPVAETLTDAATPWPLKRVVRLARDLAGALDYLHAHAIVYVTLNPASIGLTDTGGAKLLNLGLAYRLTHPEDFHWLQADPRFIAPELVRGERPTPLSDVYSLGALVYALLAGTGPFDAVESRAVVRAKAFQPPLPLAQRRPNLPSAVYTVVAKAMARDPQRRYASAGAFALALAEAASPRRALRPLARSLAVAAMLLVTALVGERALQITPPRTPVTNPAVAVSLPAPALSEATPVPPPPAIAPSSQPPLRLPLAPSVAQAAPVEEVEPVMAGRGALAWVTPEPMELAIGAPLTIIVQAQTTEPTAVPRARPIQSVVKPALVAPVVAPAIAPAPIRPITNPPVRSAPPARPPVMVPPPIVTPAPDPTVVIQTPPRQPAGWAKPVADAPAWKRP